MSSVFSPAMLGFKKKEKKRKNKKVALNCSQLSLKVEIAKLPWVMWGLANRAWGMDPKWYIKFPLLSFEMRSLTSTTSLVPCEHCITSSITGSHREGAKRWKMQGVLWRPSGPKNETNECKFKKTVDEQSGTYLSSHTQEAEVADLWSWR